MSPADVRQPRAFSTVLEELGEAGGPTLHVADMVQAFGHRGLGAVMLLIALINLFPWPPGGTTFVGFPLLLISLQLVVARQGVWLPRGILQVGLSREGYRKGLSRFLPAIRFAERLTRPRWGFLSNAGAKVLIGLVSFVLSCVLVLPVPGGNLLPAATMSLFALGLMQRDGVAILLGWLAAAASFGALVLAWSVIKAAFLHAWNYGTQLIGAG